LVMSRSLRVAWIDFRGGFRIARHGKSRGRVCDPAHGHQAKARRPAMLPSTVATTGAKNAKVTMRGNVIWVSGVARVVDGWGQSRHLPRVPSPESDGMRKTRGEGPRAAPRPEGLRWGRAAFRALR